MTLSGVKDTKNDKNPRNKKMLKFHLTVEPFGLLKVIKFIIVQEFMFSYF